MLKLHSFVQFVTAFACATTAAQAATVSISTPVTLTNNVEVSTGLFPPLSRSQTNTRTFTLPAFDTGLGQLLSVAISGRLEALVTGNILSNGIGITGGPNGRYGGEARLTLNDTAQLAELAYDDLELDCDSNLFTPRPPCPISASYLRQTDILEEFTASEWDTLTGGTPILSLFVRARVAPDTLFGMTTEFGTFRSSDDCLLPNIDCVSSSQLTVTYTYDDDPMTPPQVPLPASGILLGVGILTFGRFRRSAL